LSGVFSLPREALHPAPETLNPGSYTQASNPRVWGTRGVPRGRPPTAACVRVTATRRPSRSSLTLTSSRTTLC